MYVMTITTVAASPTTFNIHSAFPLPIKINERKFAILAHIVQHIKTAQSVTKEVINKRK